MRFLRSFFILLIGMISFTVLGTTTHLEQKQKPIVKMEYSVPVTVVNVVIANEFGLLNQSNDDVGWKTNDYLVAIIHYKEKLNKPADSAINDIIYNCRNNC